MLPNHKQTPTKANVRVGVFLFALSNPDGLLRHPTRPYDPSSWRLTWFTVLRCRDQKLSGLICLKACSHSL